MSDIISPIYFILFITTYLVEEHMYPHIHDKILVFTKSNLTSFFGRNALNDVELQYHFKCLFGIDTYFTMFCFISKYTNKYF